jgi:hypothetical protein
MSPSPPTVFDIFPNIRKLLEKALSTLRHVELITKEYKV